MLGNTIYCSHPWGGIVAQTQSAQGGHGICVRARSPPPRRWVSAQIPSTWVLPGIRVRVVPRHYDLHVVNGLRCKAGSILPWRASLTSPLPGLHERPQLAPVRLRHLDVQDSRPRMHAGALAVRSAASALLTR